MKNLKIKTLHKRKELTAFIDPVTLLYEGKKATPFKKDYQKIFFALDLKGALALISS